MEEFACLDYDKACKDNKPKADSVCIHICNCNKVTIYIVEKKEKIDPTSNKFDDAISQIENSISYLSNLCRAVRCKKILVCNYITVTGTRANRKGLPYIVEYKKIKNKKEEDLTSTEKIAKYVYENK